jgi:hypothetical protein
MSLVLDIELNLPPPLIVGLSASISVPLQDQRVLAGRGREQTAARQTFSSIVFLKIESHAIVPFMRMRSRERGSGIMGVCQSDRFHPSARIRKKPPGGRRKLLNTLISAKRIQETPSLFL